MVKPYIIAKYIRKTLKSMSKYIIYNYIGTYYEVHTKTLCLLIVLTVVNSINDL